MKGYTFVIVLLWLQCAYAGSSRVPFLFSEPDEQKSWLTDPKTPGKPQQCTITIHEPKRVTGHCVALGLGGTKGCMSGNTIIPFHPDC